LTGLKIEKLLRLLFFVLSAILFFATSSSAQKAWTLEECAAYATANNITIKQSQLTEDLNEYLLTQSRLNLLPSLNASTGYYFNFGRTIDPTTNLFVTQNTQTNSVQLSLGWPLFAGLQRVNTIKQNEYTLLASEASTKNTEQTVLLYVAGGFLDIVYAQENLRNAQDQLNLSFNNSNAQVHWFRQVHWHKVPYMTSKRRQPAMSLTGLTDRTSSTWQSLTLVNS
jgi:outer membrane protein